jgi:DNA-binding IclR family transcriptional regulator
VHAYGVMRTVRALELLAFRSMSAPELAHALPTAERTARRLLQRLALEEHVSQAAGHRRRYHLTLRMPVLGRHALARNSWLQGAAPSVAALATRTRATAQLWVPAYADVVCVLEARPGGPVPEAILGELLPAHQSAPGQVLLAHRESWRERVLDWLRDRSRAVDARDLAEELRRIRTRGHAIAHGGASTGVSVISAPVFLSADAHAALSIAFSRARAGDVIDPLVARVVRDAGALVVAPGRPGG